MPSKEDFYQPGAILHEAIIGAFKARGGSFESWCRGKGYNPALVRNATFGQSRGEKGKQMLADVIAAAGPDFVRFLYTSRMAEVAKQIARGAA